MFSNRIQDYQSRMLHPSFDEQISPSTRPVAQDQDGHSLVYAILFSLFFTLLLTTLFDSVILYLRLDHILSGDTEILVNKISDILEDQNKMDAETHTGPNRDTDKHRQKVDCHGHYYRKDPHDSHQFISVEQLCVENLPARYRSPHLVNYIRAFADLLVAVLVNCVSDKRPEKSPGTNILYPCHDMRGSKVKREGTGYISGVYIFPDDRIRGFETCECTECRNSPVLERKRQFAHVAIRTVTHLVFDEEEGNETTCKCEPRDSSGGNGFEFSNMRYVTNGVHCDWCLMTYVTHDMEFVNMIQKLVTRRDNLKDILVAESLLSMSDEERGKDSGSALQGKLNITISHSNEHDKQVSIVEYEHLNGTEAHSHSHINASVACAGSCGAPVQVIDKDWRLYAMEHNHSGHYTVEDKPQSNVNYSCVGIGFTPFNHKHAEDKKNLHNKSYEHKTTEECWDPEFKEQEVNLEHVNCKKNKDHGDFIPVPEFQIENLPPGYRNKNVMACIQAVISLTVLMSVTFTSKGRPKTFPFSNKPYTGNEYKGTKKRRTGTGLVHDIVRFPNEDSKGSETCPCKECKSSSSPKTEFAYVTVHSVAHVVIDSSEGEHTICYLSFDKGSAPDFPEVMELESASVVVCDVNKDTCKMIFVTHNLPLIDRLCGLVGHWQSLQQKLEHAFIISPSINENSPSGGHSDSNHGGNPGINHDSNSGSNHDNNPGINHDSNYDSNSGSNHDSNSGSNHGSNSGSNHDNNPGINHDSNYDSNHGLTVIVSHPHGCSKHVSIGHCVNMNATGQGYTECHYTTPTCPGCSGAYVFVVGKFWKCWNKHHYGI